MLFLFGKPLTIVTPLRLESTLPKSGLWGNLHLFVSRPLLTCADQPVDLRWHRRGLEGSTSTTKPTGNQSTRPYLDANASLSTPPPPSHPALHGTPRRAR